MNSDHNKKRKEQKKKGEWCGLRLGRFVLKCKMAQSNPKPPSQLCFSFLFSFTCSASHMLPATGSNAFHHRDAQVAAGENVSQKLETFVVSVHLCSVNLCTLTLVLHSPHPWQVVDNCKTSMVELILQLLVHCLNSPCIFPTTHKWQDLAAHPGCRTHRPNKVLLETLFLTHNQ